MALAAAAFSDQRQHIVSLNATRTADERSSHFKARRSVSATAGLIESTGAQRPLPRPQRQVGRLPPEALAAAAAAFVPVGPSSEGAAPSQSVRPASAVDSRFAVAPSPGSLRVRSPDVDAPSPQPPTLTTGPVGVPATQRRSGSIVAKHVLTATKQLKLSQAAKRAWIGFWAVLRGPTLGFFGGREACVAQELPLRQLIVEGCLALPAEDGTKRHHVLMLALPAGDLFYLQADSDTSCHEWIRELHLSALVSDAVTTDAAGLAKYISDKIRQLERQLKLETDHKRVAQLQLATGACGDYREIGQVRAFPSC